MDSVLQNGPGTYMYLVTAHTELVQVYSVNFPTLLQSFGHFSMNLVRNRAIVTTKTPLLQTVCNDKQQKSRDLICRTYVEDEQTNNPILSEEDHGRRRLA